MKESLNKIRSSAARRAADASKSIGSATDAFTGKAVEAHVTEYSEVFGQILIGLHRRVEEQSTEVSRLRDLCEAEQEFLRRSEVALTASVDAQRALLRASRGLRLAVALSIASLALALASLLAG
jgi:hypothetical protein